MGRLALVLGVHAAASHDGHVRAFPHIKIVIDQVVDVPLRHAGRDINRFPLRARADVDHQPRCVGFGLDLDIVSGLAAGALAVFPNIERAFKGAGKIRNHSEQFIGHLVHYASSFPRGQ